VKQIFVKVLEGMMVAAFTAVGTALGQRLADELDPPEEEYSKPRRKKRSRR